jgi:O-antigen ligase
LIITKIENIFKNINFKNLIYATLLVVTLSLSLVFGQIVNANDGSFGNGMSLYIGIPFYSLIILLYTFLIFVGIRQKIIKTGKKLFIAISIGVLMILYMLLVVLCTNYSLLEESIRNEKTITSIDKTYSILDFSLVILFMFAVFFLFPKFKEKDLILRFVSFLVFIFCSIAIIYSLATEFSSYIEAIKTKSFFEKSYGVMIKSFFTYGNVFGHLMFIGSLFLTFLAISYKNKWLLLFNFIPFVFVIFSGSRTGAIAEVGLTLIFAIYALLGLRKKHKITFYIILGISLFVVLFLILDIFAFHLIKFKQNTNDGVKELTLYDLMLLFFKTMNSRFSIVEAYFSLMSPSNIVFGIGYDINDYFFRNCIAAQSTFNLHNGYAEMFSSGGVVLALLYVFLFGYLFFITYKTIKNKTFNWIYLLIILLPSAIYQLSEAFPAFFNYFGGGCMGVLLFVPVLTDYRKEETNIIKF